MRVAHILMVHKNPEQVYRLLRRMSHHKFYFFVHVDKKVSLKPFQILKELPNVVFIQHRKKCNWGGYSFVKAILSAVDEVLQSGMQFSYINLMSGQDYPLRSADELYSFYKENPKNEFISFDLDEDRTWWNHAVTRYERYHFTDFPFRGKYRLQEFANAVLPKRKFPLSVKLYGSSDSSWWTLSSEAASYLLDFMKGNAPLRRFMRTTWTADEFLIATIIMNSPYRNRVVNDNLRYIDWTEGNANPKTLGMDDLNSLRMSGKFFARKFDMHIDENILNVLDKLLNEELTDEVHMRRG